MEAGNTSTPVVQENSVLNRVHSNIDRLPDDILITILSLLTVEEAAATSILSRRVLHLRYFEMINWFNLKSLEISAANLELFTYLGPKIDVPFGSGPHCLLEATIGGSFGESFVFGSAKHLVYLSQLETLTFDVSFEYFLQWPFTLHQSLIGLHPYPTRRSEANRYAHQHLEVVELIGFHGRANELNLATRLLQIAVNLKRMVLQFHSEKQKEDCSSRKFVARFRKTLPPAVELVVC